ncbi:MAG: hypothetical protein HeimC3_34780 [Candidatus Heimdallarchaeota archaeon LC_3]|nr:MAG: hypothetical protein HeimC3_34780 [Candidatus Heimdallarchaeota archaeon LC_3]
MEGGAVTNEYGNFLKDLKNNMFRKGDIRKIHKIIKEDVINFIKKNQEKKRINLEMDSINSLLIDFLGEVKIILNYNDQLINFHLTNIF